MWRHILAVVEDQGERRLEAGKEDFKKSQRKDVNPNLVFRRQMWQRYSAAVRSGQGGEAEIVEERCRIGVTGIHTVPRRIAVPHFDPAGVDSA